MKRKTKQTLKTIALGVVGLGAVVGAASLVSNLRSEDDGLKTIHPTFEVGGLKDADGKFEETKKSIYTKNAFECQGLEIEVDFDNNIKYQVFYYESDGDFISATNVFNGNQDLEVPFGATHARLEITPNWAEMGEDYKDTKNQEVKWYDVAKYSTQLDIKVNKEQVSLTLTDDLCEVDTSMSGKYYGENLTTFIDHEAITSSKIIEVDNYSQVKIVAPTNNAAAVTCIAQFFDSNGNNLEFPIAYFDFETTNGNVKVFDIPSNAKYFSLALITAVAEDYQIYFA